MFKQFGSSVKRSFYSLQSLNFIAPLLIRLYLGLTLAFAGFFKLNILGTERVFNEVIGLSALHGSWLSVIAYSEFIIGVLLILGFLTRLSSLILIIVSVAVYGLAQFQGVWVFLTGFENHTATTVPRFIFWAKAVFMPHPSIEVMLLGSSAFFLLFFSLFFSGAGKYTSMDYWLRALRGFMDTSSDTLFVSNLDYKVDRNELRSMFSSFGELLDVKVIKDNKGQSRCFGFVAFKNVEDAKRARKAMAGKIFHKRRLNVNCSRSKKR